MKFKILASSLLGAVALMSFGVATASAAVTASCAGTPTASNITWVAASTGGVSPVNYLWSNGSTSTTQTVAYTPGTYAMGITATDASSTVATSTCSATVAVPTISLPSVTSFTATPMSITVGQSAVLSWATTNASTTSIDNGVGVVTGNSITITPIVTTTYTLSAINAGGATAATATVTVVATSTPSTPPSATTTIPLFRRSGLVINEDGHFFGKGMIVQSAGAGSFVAKVWGMTFTINSATAITVGDYVDVRGMIDASGAVIANKVKSFPAFMTIKPKVKHEEREGRRERRHEEERGMMQQMGSSTVPGMQGQVEFKKEKRPEGRKEFKREKRSEEHDN